MASSSHPIPLSKGKIRLTGYTPKHPDLEHPLCACEKPQEGEVCSYVRHWGHGGSVHVGVCPQVSEPCWVPDRLCGLRSVPFLWASD